MNSILVVAAAIKDSESQLLMQRRPAGKRHAGLWEFPGGKVEPGELARAALARELAEELGIVACPESLRPISFAEDGPDRDDPGILLLLYALEKFEGTPTPESGAAIGWFEPGEIARLPLPPLDRELLRALRSGDR